MSELDALAAVIIAYLAILLVLFVVSYILTAVGYMKVFDKANEAGWKGWVPFLNEYTSFKISWNANMFWIMLVLSFLQFLLIGSENSLLRLLSNAAAMGVFVIRCLQCTKLSKSFGHGIGFALGLLFLGPIFMMILGFGSSQYEGIQE